MSQPPTSCRERQKTCTTPPNSWQHVDWGSGHGWSTAEEEKVTWTYTILYRLHLKFGCCGVHLKYRLHFTWNVVCYGVHLKYRLHLKFGLLWGSLEFCHFKLFVKVSHVCYTWEYMSEIMSRTVSLLLCWKFCHIFSVCHIKRCFKV